MRFVLRALASALAAAGASSWAQVWEVPAAPGVLYRMEVQAEPPLLAVGLRIDPAKIRREPVMTLGAMFQKSRANGRDTVSGMVQRADAIGGINGDFFQWGDDPGGDPMGLMARGGELLSLPGRAARSSAVGWGPGAAYRIMTPRIDLKVKAAGREIQIRDLNSRTDKGGVTLSGEAAGEAYGPGRIRAVRVLMPALRLTGASKASGRVLAVMTGDRFKIASGEVVLSCLEGESSLLDALHPGDSVELTVSTKGWKPAEIPYVIGGGPVLLKSGVYVGPPVSDSFSGTRHPRSAMGLTPEGQVWHIVIDGRQTMSVGASLPETAALLKKWGCSEGFNLDGGGSSALNLFGATLNRPSGGVERQVGNGIAFYAQQPVAPGPKFTITGPDAVKAGQSAQLGASAAGPVIWSAQGGAWISGDGVLRGWKAGRAVVTALAQGRLESREITVEP